MSIKSIFGSVFFSALAALIIYDLVVKGLVEKVRNQYDDTFDNFSGKSAEQFEPGTICVDRYGRKFVAA